jgi:hypothetical protein
MFKVETDKKGRWNEVSYVTYNGIVITDAHVNSKALDAFMALPEAEAIASYLANHNARAEWNAIFEPHRLSMGLTLGEVRSFLANHKNQKVYIHLSLEMGDLVMQFII